MFKIAFIGLHVAGENQTCDCQHEGSIGHDIALWQLALAYPERTLEEGLFT